MAGFWQRAMALDSANQAKEGNHSTHTHTKGYVTITPIPGQ